MGFELKRLSVTLTRIPEHKQNKRWVCPKIRIEKIIKIDLISLTAREIDIHTYKYTKEGLELGSEENPIVIEDDSLDG